jgi:hypothetical protein
MVCVIPGEKIRAAVQTVSMIEHSLEDIRYRLAYVETKLANETYINTARYWATTAMCMIIAGYVYWFK